MRTLLKANAGYLARHPWQLGLLFVAVAIGVAVIVAVDLANSSARKAFLLSMDTVSGETTHQIVGGPLGVSETAYVELRRQHGLTNIAPVVEGTVLADGVVLDVLGVDLFAEQSMRSFTTEVNPDESDAGDAGTALFRDILVEPGATLLSPRTAAQLGLEPGAAFEIESGGRRQTARLLATFADTSGTLDNLAVVDISTAQHWLAAPGYLTRIDVRIDANSPITDSELRAILPKGTALLDAEGRTRSTAEMSQAFMTNLTAMSLLALLVGLFLIYNSVSFSVLQRRPLIGTLRALGVTRRQVFGLVLLEAAVLGVLASAAGIALGTWLGELLLGLVSQSINDFYYRVTVTDVSLDSLTIAKGLFAGIIATLASALAPALEAASYTPRLTMLRSTLESRTRSVLPTIAMLGVATVAAAALLLGVSGRHLVAGLAAVFMLILGVAFCVPLLVSLATRITAPLADAIGGVQARLAIGGIGASLSRTGVAIVSLAVAVSATIGVSVMVDSFRGSVSNWLENTLQADVYAGPSRGDFDPALLQDITALDAVEAVSTSRRAWLEDTGGRTQVTAVRMAPGSYAGTELLDATAAEVWPVFENEDTVLVSEPYAYRFSVRRGDRVLLRTQQGEQPFVVAATFQSYDINASALLMSRATYDRHFDDPGVDSIGLYLRDSAQAAAVIERIQAMSDGRQRILTTSNVDIRALSLAVFDRTFVITHVLYWLAIGVAIVGILGSMLALQLERARDLALLRAVGMTPRQLGGMISLQTGVIGLFSGLAAIPLGLVMAYVLITVINRRAFGWKIDMTVAPDIIGSALLFSVAAALVAGLYPAWRAARSEPALAMREE